MTTEEIEGRFKRDVEIYCPHRFKYIPCFDAFILRTTNFIVSTQTPPRRVLELGAGSGFLSALYRMYFPNATYILCDFEDNLQIARKWFADAGNVEIIGMDYSKEFPTGPFDIIISAFSIHHFPDETKKRILQMTYDALPEGALMVNYDLFRASYGIMDAWQNGYLETELLRNGLSRKQISSWRHRLGADEECTVASEMHMMREIGYQAIGNVYTNLKFSVITGVH